MPMKNNVYVISCDWFSVAAVSPLVDDWVFPQESMPEPNSAKNTPTESEDFLLEGMQRAGLILNARPRTFGRGYSFEYGAERFVVDVTAEFSPAYADSFSLLWHGKTFCHVFYRPRRPEVDRHSMQVKVHNAALYCTQWPSVLQLAMRSLQAKFVRIVRVDVCADFEYFYNGRLPLRFCQDYLSRPTASRPSFIRKSSNKIRCQGVKAFDKLLWETLSWGTRDSAVQTNLYNKTKELQAVHDKPYIRERWAAYGLPDDVSKQTKRFVWRLEFSLNPSAKFIVEKGSPFARLREIMLSDFESYSALRDIFSALVPQFFQFYYLTRDDVRRGRRVKDLQPVVLFSDLDAAPFKIQGYSSSRVSGRTESIMIRRLESILQTESLPPAEFEAIGSTLKTLRALYAKRQEQHDGQLLPVDLLRAFFRTLDNSRGGFHWLSMEQRRRELDRFCAMVLKRREYSDFEESYREFDELLERMRADLQQITDTAPAWFFDCPDEEISEEDWDSLTFLPEPESALNTTL